MPTERMPLPDWTREFPAAVTVCDREGIVLAMNDRSAATFQQDGGASLVGRNLLDCHPKAARAKIRELLSTGRTNAYTIEKGGVKKLIYQAPWYEQGQLMGLVELSLPIPAEMPHFVRK